MQSPSLSEPSTDYNTSGCKNCGTVLMPNAQYCYHCGQKDKERFTFKILFTDIITTYIGFDGIFFRTIKDMVTQPGVMVREYLAGKQKPYLKPVQYYLLSLGLYFLITYTLNVNPLSFGNTINQQLGLPVQEQSLPKYDKTGKPIDAKTLKKMASQQKEMQKFMKVFQENLKVIFTSLIPIFALSMLICYRKSNYNYLELIILTLYANGTSYLLFSLQSFTIFLTSQSALWVTITLTSIISLASVFYLVWVTYQFFDTKGWKGGVLAISCYCLMVLLYFVFITIASVLLGIGLSLSGNKL
jgi:hypothetical protein